MVISARLLKVVAKIPMKSGIAKDFVDLDFHYVAPTGYGTADFDNWASNFEDFWNNPGALGVQPLKHYLPESIASGSDLCQIMFYAVPAVPGPLGAPVGMASATMPAGVASGLPSEVCAAFSFRSDYGAAVEFGPGGATRPRARLRNRIFLGPLNLNSEVIDGTTGRVGVGAQFRVDALSAFKDSMVTAMDGDGWLLKVFSPTAWLDHVPVEAWMDNAFDTQRRRGVSPTSRETQAL